jgi:hypothetical protein
MAGKRTAILTWMAFFFSPKAVAQRSQRDDHRTQLQDRSVPRGRIYLLKKISRTLVMSGIKANKINLLKLKISFNYFFRFLGLHYFQCRKQAAGCERTQTEVNL